jgi:hypothetical protein
VSDLIKKKHTILADVMKQEKPTSIVADYSLKCLVLIKCPADNVTNQKLPLGMTKQDLKKKLKQ